MYIKNQYLCWIFSSQVVCITIQIYRMRGIYDNENIYDEQKNIIYRQPSKNDITGWLNRRELFEYNEQEWNPHVYPIQYSKYNVSRIGQPQIHYSIVIDAGSSGSRVYVYMYAVPNGICKDNQVDISKKNTSILHITLAENYKHEYIVKKISPGISFYIQDYKEAYQSLVPLIEYALDNIPDILWKYTRLYIYATAGLRLQPSYHSDGILRELRIGCKKLSIKKGFLYTDENILVLSGEDEGQYAWQALNYAHNRIGEIYNDIHITGELDPHSGELYNTNLDKDIIISSNDDDTNFITTSLETVGLIELGGGSAQIAYEIDPTTIDNSINFINNNVNNVTCIYIHILGNKKTCIRSISFLGYGTWNVRKKYLNKLINDNNSIKYIQDPCLLYNQKETILSQIEEDGITKNFILLETTINDTNIIYNEIIELPNSTLYFLNGTSDWYTCRNKLKTLYENNELLDNKKNIYNNTMIISEINKKKNFQFFALSEYWYTTQNILKIPPKQFNSILLEQRSVDICNNTNFIIKDIDINQLVSLCFKTAWLDTLLFQHHQFPRNSEKNSVIPFNTFYAMEVQWTLGALLHQITSELRNDNSFICYTASIISNLRNSYNNYSNNIYFAKLYENIYTNQLLQNLFYGPKYIKINSKIYSFKNIFIRPDFIIIILFFIIVFFIFFIINLHDVILTDNLDSTIISRVSKD